MCPSRSFQVPPSSSSPGGARPLTLSGAARPKPTQSPPQLYRLQRAANKYPSQNSKKSVIRHDASIGLHRLMFATRPEVSHALNSHDRGRVPNGLLGSGEHAEYFHIQTKCIWLTSNYLANFLFICDDA